MTINMLRKLSKNPHYKLSQKQIALLAEYEAKERKPMVEFGKPQTHNGSVEKHPQLLKRERR